MADTEDLYESPYSDLVAALGALTEAPRAGKVNAGQRQYKFMTLPDLLGQVRPVFAQHHLAVTQLVHNHETGISVETRFLHSSGHVFDFPPLTLRCAQDPQSIGSAITYGRRYALAALVGLAGDDDDDGQHATRTTPKPTTDDRPAAKPVGFTKGDIGPGTASKGSGGYLWSLLRGLGTDEAGIRTWVANVLQIDADWHTYPDKDGTVRPNTLSQAQVSTLIERLKAAPAQAGDTTPPADPE